MAKQNPRPLLIVEDDPGLQSQLRWCFDEYDVIFAGDREAAITELRRHEPPVITLDLGLPPDPTNATEGLATLEEILRLAPHTKVIVVTGNDNRENALKAISLGAYDYYQKPIDPALLGLIIDRAKNLYDIEAENRRLSQNNANSQLEGVIAASPQMVKTCRVVEKVGPADITALILGESGTGKELVARSLHELSARRNKPFVAINCAAIPENLLESELFGFEKGAFTGANKQVRGKIEYAEGGTFFLDEVGDLPMALQAKMLRFLQERVIERIGGRQEISVDVRVICATHQNLEALIESQRFREDLFYRISEVNISIPPLRDREGDVTLLARIFLGRFCEQLGRAINGFTAEAIDSMGHYGWPGNVRELENKVKRAVIMADGNKITAEDLDLKAASDTGEHYLNLREVRDNAERGALQNAIALTHGQVSKAADLLGVSRPTLYDLMNKHGLR
ncbi:MAG: PEP-CTERM-box response regulator transcription factor [Gammaproteobacteria bacterium]|nr:PEP-CTERM-box response regulator transcription factor [Gammaproteobacteria bacterium]